MSPKTYSARLFEAASTKDANGPIPEEARAVSKSLNWCNHARDLVLALEMQGEAS